MLADVLTKRFSAVYVAFLENQCLEFFGNHTFHVESVHVIREYCAGLFAMLYGLDGAIDATLQQHLHKPQNLFYLGHTGR